MAGYKMVWKSGSQPLRCLYDPMRQAAPLVWLVVRCSISRGGGCLSIGFNFGCGLMGSGDRLVFVGIRLWLVTRWSGKVAVSSFTISCGELRLWFGWLLGSAFPGGGVCLSIGFNFGCGLVGSGDRLVFVGIRLWLVIKRSGQVAVSLYDLMRRVALLVWLVGGCSISRGGGGGGSMEMTFVSRGGFSGACRRLLCDKGGRSGLFRQRFVCALACGHLRSLVCGSVSVSLASAVCVSVGFWIMSP